MPRCVCVCVCVKTLTVATCCQLSRRMFPREVVALEHEWGNWLVEQKQLDAAINHFIEAGQYVKGVYSA